MNPFNGGWVVLLSLLVAMLFAVAHLPQDWPEWLAVLQPNWVLLVLFFWVMELPERIGLVSAWLIGLVMDALLAQPLGLNGLILAGFTYITWRFYERLRMYSVVQQCGVIFILVLLGELVRGSIIGLNSTQELSWTLVFSALISMLLWPFLYLLLIRIRTKVRIE